MFCLAANVTTLTENGYVGDDVEVVLYNLYKKANGDYYFKAYGLVFKVQPIKYALVDELEFFKVLTVNDYKE